jgi:hypothetical protein
MNGIVVIDMAEEIGSRRLDWPEAGAPKFMQARRQLALFYSIKKRKSIHTAEKALPGGKGIFNRGKRRAERTKS